MAAPATRAPSTRRATFPFDSRDTFLLGSRTMLPLRPPHRLPLPTAAPTTPGAIPLLFTGMDFGAESATTLALRSSTTPPVQQGTPCRAGLSSKEAAPGVEQPSLPLQAATAQQPSLPLQAVTAQQPSLPLQAVTAQQPSLPLQTATAQQPSIPLQAATAIRQNQAATATAAPPLQHLPSTTVVSNSGGDAFRADESSGINMHCNYEEKRSGGEVKEVEMMESMCSKNIHKRKGEISLEDDERTIKIMIDKAVQNAITGAWDSRSHISGLKVFINDSVNKAVHDSLLSRQPSNSYLSRADHMKLVRDALSEHQTFSRVLYVLALGTPVTLLITRAVRGESSDTSKSMIVYTGVEMGLSFLIVSVCHFYIILFHFVRTEGPRISIWLMRLVILFLCLLVSAWMLIYTLYMPHNLFLKSFWWITGTSLVIDWAVSAFLGCTGLLREGWMLDVE